MSNEKPLNSNEALVNFTSDYEYILGATTGRLLEFQGLFHSYHFMDEQIEQIRYDLEATAKHFAEEQGLAPGAKGWGFGGWNLDGTPIYRENTGRLYNGIRAYKTGQTVHLVSEAKDDYGHYYGGHVEFGHQNVPARPHLRPALYTVSQASRGKLRSALHNLLAGAISGDSRMAFGTGGGLSASYYRNGQGNVTKYLTTGNRATLSQRHFGSIRNYSRQTSVKAAARRAGINRPVKTRGITRKAGKFRQGFSSTAKKTMGWGKQKSLNAVQRNQYRRSHTTKGRAARSRITQGRRERAASVKRERAYNREVKKSNAFLASQQYKSASSVQSYRQQVSAAKQQMYQDMGKAYQSPQGLRTLYGQTIVHGQNYRNQQYSGNKPTPSTKSNPERDRLAQIAARYYSKNPPK